MFESALSVAIVVSFVLGFYAKDWAKCNTWKAKVQDVFFGELNGAQEKELLTLCAQTLGKSAKRKATEKKAQEIHNAFIKEYPALFQEKALQLAEVMTTDRHWKLRNFLVDSFGKEYPYLSRTTGVDYKTWWWCLGVKDKNVFGRWARKSIQKELS